MAKFEEGGEKVFGFVLPAGVDGELVRQTVLTYLAVVFMMMIFLLFILPRFADLAVIGNKVNDLVKREETLTKAQSNLDDFKTNVDPVSRDLVFLAIPARFDPGLILLSLRKLAADNNVNLMNYTLGGGKVTEAGSDKGDQLVTHVVNVTISGPAPALINFVNGLDHYLPLVSVTDLSISEVSKILTQTAAELKLELSLAYYHLPVVVKAAETLEGKEISESDKQLILSLLSFNRLQVTPAASAPAPGSGNEKLFGF